MSTVFIHCQAEQTIGGSNGLEPTAAPVVLPAALGMPRDVLQLSTLIKLRQIWSLRIMAQLRWESGSNSEPQLSKE
jgi:hypothetical protein